jgi:hypothetical protein
VFFPFRILSVLLGFVYKRSRLDLVFCCYFPSLLYLFSFSSREKPNRILPNLAHLLILCVFTSVLCGVNKEVKENNNKKPNPISRLIVERHLPTIASDAYGIGFVEETRTTRDQYCGCVATVSDRNCFTSHPEFWGNYDGNRRNKLIRESIFIRSTWNNIFFSKKIFCWAALKCFKNNSAAYEKNFRLRDKNHAS